MKRFETICVVAFMIFIGWGSSLLAKDIKIGLQWTPYENAKTQGLKEMRIFKRTLPDGVYDYAVPFKVVPQTISTAETGQPSEVELIVIYPDGQKTSIGFVMRAVSDEAIESENSNEVSMEVDLTPLLAITDFTGVYNPVTKSIDFTWTQGDIDRITSWKLYQADTAGGPYTEINSIPWDGSSTVITASKPIVQDPGTTKTYYFVVVGFSKFLNTADSNQVTVTIIRRPTPAKVINLKVIIK